ncbi:MAG: FtsH protease activity modulator HflK [Alphaproteobacteria bacterium]
MGKGDKGGWQGGSGPWGKPPGNGPQPQGGGDPHPQGPDFDEWMRKSQEKIHQMFPGGGDNKKGFVLLLSILLLLWLSTGVYFVQADEQGVVLRFGEYHRTTGAGVNYHLPYPVEKAFTPKVTTVNRIEVGFRSGYSASSKSNQAAVPEESLMLSGDENIVDVNFEVQWKISNAPDYLFNVRNAEGTVKSVSESAMREVIGRTEIASVLAEGRLGSEQASIEIAAKKLTQGTLDEYTTGVEIISVNLTKVEPPTEVIDAFRDVQSAKIDLETARNRAEAYRNDILPRARGAAEKMVLDAEAYKEEVIARAKGEASRFSSVYEEYRQAKDVTKKRMYLETMEQILQDMNKVIIDGKGSQGVLPYLPLPEIKNKAETN